MSKGGSRRYEEAIVGAISSYFTISHIDEESGVYTFKIPKKSYDPEKFRLLYYQLRTTGYYAYSNGEDEIIVFKKSVNPRKNKLKVLLLVLTLLTIFYAGYSYSSTYYVTFPPIKVALFATIFFLIPVSSILFVRELPKYLLRKKRKQSYSLPILVPNPFLMGTMGIINSTDEPFLNPNDEITAGFVSIVSGFGFSIILMILGYMGFSLYNGHYLPTDGALSALYSPVFIKYLGGRFIPDFGYLDPLSLSGWVGITFTAFNSFPIGLMDGGLLLSGMKRTLRVNISYIFLTVMVAISLTYLSWLILPLFLASLGMGTIEPADSNVTISNRKTISILTTVLVIGVIALTPFPVHQSSPVVSISESGQWQIVGNVTSNQAKFEINITNIGLISVEPAFSISPSMPMEVATTSGLILPGQTSDFSITLNTTDSCLGLQDVKLGVLVGTIQKTIDLNYLKLNSSDSFTHTIVDVSNKTGNNFTNITFSNRGLTYQNVTLAIAGPMWWHYKVSINDSSYGNNEFKVLTFTGSGSNTTGGITFPMAGASSSFSYITVSLQYNKIPEIPIYVAIYNNTYTGSVAIL